MVCLAVLVVGALMVGQPDRVVAQATENTPPSVLLADYETALTQARDVLATANDDTAVETARQILSAIEQVQLPKGDTVTLRPILGDSGQPLAHADALARLTLVLHQLQAASTDDAAARLAVLANVLTGPEFSQGESLWDRFRRWLDELWNRFFPERTADPTTAAAVETTGNIVGWAFAIAGTAALIWLLSYWLRGLIHSFVANAERSGPDMDGDGAPQTPAEARQRAGNLALTGNYRDAVRHLYLSALLTLEERGLVTHDRSLTNREVLASLAPEHPLRPHMQPVVDTFDAVWYGVQEPDDQTYHSYTHAIDALEALAHTQDKG